MMINAISKTNRNIYLAQNIEIKQNKEKHDFAPNSVQKNNLTFSQANAIKNSLLLNNVTFKGRIVAPSFDIKDIETIQNLVSICHYGKKDLIYGDISKIKLQKVGLDVSIENFYTNDKDGKITGICEELTYKLGKRLEKLFGDKYIFFAINGSNKEFPGGHTHLGMMKNTPENKHFIELQSDKFTLAQQIYKETDAIFASLTDSEQTKIVDKYNNLRLRTEDLKGSLIIDPSFNRIEEFGCGGRAFDGYISDAIRTLKQVDAVPLNSRIIPLSQGIPIGYVKDLIPGKANGEAMVALHNFGEIIPSIGCDFRIIKKLSKKHPFVKFIAKLNEGVAE